MRPSGTCASCGSDPPPPTQVPSSRNDCGSTVPDNPFVRTLPHTTMSGHQLPPAGTQRPGPAGPAWFLEVFPVFPASPGPGEPWAQQRPRGCPAPIPALLWSLPSFPSRCCWGAGMGGVFPFTDGADARTQPILRRTRVLMERVLRPRRGSRCPVSSSATILLGTGGPLLGYRQGLFSGMELLIF
uniref:ATPase H+ transporting V0 subunit e2 n=1 Tax=Gorilla gorilla gorilla TaxID=9595 RepID=G3QVH8_GORGO